MHLLLVLDNFEHLLEAAAMVAALLRACPRLKLLVTSRETLGILGEQTYHVPVMQIPPSGPVDGEAIAQYEGIRLFVDRAIEKQHDVALSPANLGTIAEICRQVDGLPLAIELAAARLGHFPSLQDLQAQLRRGLAQLTGGRRSCPSACAR